MHYAFIYATDHSCAQTRCKTRTSEEIHFHKWSDSRVTCHRCVQAYTHAIHAYSHAIHMYIVSLRRRTRIG